MNETKVKEHVRAWLQREGYQFIERIPSGRT